MSFIDTINESRSRIADSVNSSFFIGPDVEITENVSLPPKGTQEWHNILVTISKEHLPPLKGLYREDLSLLEGSLKSRRAQTGIDLWENPGDLVNQFIRRHCYGEDYARNLVIFHRGVGLEFPGLRELCYKKGYRDLVDIFQEPLIIPIKISNRSTRPIRLEQNMGLFRFYCPLTPPVTGDQLKSLVGSEIKVAGEENRDWALSYNQEGVATGMFIRIKPETESWMMPNEEPVLVRDDDKDYRQTIDQYYQPLRSRAPFNYEEILCIGETPRVTLSKRVIALIYKAVSPTITGEEWLEMCPRLHIQSHLIDGGTDWGIRTETLVEYPRKSQEQYIYLDFFLVT